MSQLRTQAQLKNCEILFKLNNRRAVQQNVFRMLVVCGSAPTNCRKYTKKRPDISICLLQGLRRVSPCTTSSSDEDSSDEDFESSLRTNLIRDGNIHFLIYLYNTSCLYHSLSCVHMTCQNDRPFETDSNPSLLRKDGNYMVFKLRGVGIYSHGCIGLFPVSHPLYFRLMYTVKIKIFYTKFANIARGYFSRFSILRKQTFQFY